jgi:hypothetical protein
MSRYHEVVNAGKSGVDCPDTGTEVNETQTEEQNARAGE